MPKASDIKHCLSYEKPTKWSLQIDKHMAILWRACNGSNGKHIWSYRLGSLLLYAQGTVDVSVVLFMSSTLAIG